MNTLTVSTVEDVGNDQLRVVGVDSAGNQYEAFGWVSATTNHFAADAYAEHAVVDEKWVVADAKTPDDAQRDVHRVEKAAARAMTDAEVGEYALRLLLDQNRDLRLAEPVEVAAIAFEAPAPVSLEAADES